MTRDACSLVLRLEFSLEPTIANEHRNYKSQHSFLLRLARSGATSQQAFANAC